MNINTICLMITNPQLLNALHACREGHPWNKTTQRPWTNAWALACQRKSYEINGAARDWLKHQATLYGE